MEVGEEGEYIPIATLSRSGESHFNVSVGSDGLQKSQMSQDGVHKPKPV